MIETFNIKPGYLDEMPEIKRIFWSELFLRNLFTSTTLKNLSSSFPSETDNLLIKKITGPVEDNLYLIKVTPRQYIQEANAYIKLDSSQNLKLFVGMSITYASNQIYAELRLLGKDKQSELASCQINALRDNVICFKLPRVNNLGRHSPLAQLLLRKQSARNVHKRANASDFFDSMSQAAANLSNQSNTTFEEKPVSSTEGISHRTACDKAAEQLTKNEYFEKYIKEEELENKKGSFCPSCTFM